MTNPDPNDRQPLHTNAYAPPTAPFQPPMAPPPLSPHQASLGQRIAGALLISNAVIVVLERVVMPADPTSKDPFDSPGRIVMPIVIDVLIGFALLMKTKGVVPWAIFRAALGLIVFVALRAFQGDLFLAVMQIAVSSALLLLLIGDASKPRIAVSGALFGMYALISLIGIGSTVTGNNPLAPVIQSASGNIESEPAGTVVGLSSHYRVTAPSDKWHLRKAEAAKKDNPLADRWLTRPDVDAHVIIIAEKITGGMIVADALTDVVIDNAQKVSTQFKLVDRKPLRTHPEEGRILRTQSTVNGLDIESLVGVVGYYEHGFQIVAFAPRVSFAAVESDLRSIVESFQKPMDERPGAPEDCEPNPVTRIEGLSQKYDLTLSGANWFLRRDAIAKKDNELADRWVLRPDVNASILVIAEEAPGAVLDPDKYTDAIVDNVKKNATAVILSREPSKSNPKNGRILHTKSTVDGTRFEYLYGLFAEGPRAFQLVAFSQEENFNKVEADLRQTIESFKLPAK